MAPKIIPAIDRFMRFVQPEPNTGCWLWTGGTGEGYGSFFLPAPKRKVMAHRFAYETFVGPIPTGMEVRHTCDVRLCVNHHHMLLGTKQENRADMAERWRGVRSRSGLPFGVSVDRSRRTVAYNAMVKYHNETQYLGRFSTIEEAASVALAAKNALYSVDAFERGGRGGE